MALDPNIIGSDTNDYLVATPGTNVIDAGAGDDTIVTVDGDNTILENVGSGMDTISFAPARTYQYAGFLEEAQNALDALTGVTDPVTDAYFGTLASSVLINCLPTDIKNVLKMFKPKGKGSDGAPPPLGTVDADTARQAFQSLIDWINAPSQDVIQFGAGITPADLSFQVLAPATNFGAPNQFQVSINGQDGMIFQLGRPDLVAAPTTGSSAPPALPITFQFADGTTMTLADLMSAPTNHDPVVATPIGDQNATQNAAFSFQIPAGTFTDPDAGDMLTLSASALDANGNPVALPAWLKFDAATGSFSGTPANGDVGNVSVQVTATDLAGASAFTTLNIGVANVNDAPVASVATVSATATQDAAFTYALPPNLFTDVDKGDVLTLSASALDANGNPVALPAWLKFDPATGSFSGTPANGDVGNVSVQVTATDLAGASASAMLSIGVANVNDAPTAQATSLSAAATQDKAFSYALPAGFFTDVDKGDVLTLSASALDANGNPVALPAWLKFDPATGSFSGTPANGDVGNLSLQVTATDMAGAKASTTLNIGVANVNDAPQMMVQIADQSAVVGNAFSLTVPATAFRDIDVGDTLTFGATLANGGALPSWLVFDAATRTLHGTPGAGAAGTMSVQILATDVAGASASDVFALNISAPPVTSPPPLGSPPPVDPPLGKTIVGDSGNNTLNGTAGNDVLQGNRGRDLLYAGNGDDLLYFSQDANWTGGATRRNNGSPGHSGTGETVSIAGKAQSQDILDGGAGYDTLIGTSGSDAILLDDTSSPAQRTGPRIVGIEKIEAGAGNDVVDLTSRRYAYGDVTIDGGSGNDVMWSSSGNDVLLGGSGNDRMDGGAGNDYLYGGTGRDVLNGGEGVDVLQGGSGRDQLNDTSGNGMLDGGSGNDLLTGGSNNLLFIGGTGNDTIKLGGGSNVVAFNRGDGQDVVQAGSAGSSTLSLGAGIRLQDLAFRRSGDNLVLETGNNESITFDNWYRSRSNQAFTKLQFVTEGMPGAGSGPLLDDKVETFDFRKLVGAFDSARARNPGLSKWALTNGLAAFHLDDHNSSKAVGGDLAYNYGVADSMAGIGVSAAQDVLGSSQFGNSAQTLHPVSGLKEGLVKLA